VTAKQSENKAITLLRSQFVTTFEFFAVILFVIKKTFCIFASFIPTPSGEWGDGDILESVIDALFLAI
jgi:hypothetical protein